ncbi:NAD(P)H-quinone oxidoreductase subunit U [Citrus sinensis]|uniref:NAD(P)H-quinone oxidoreductase subunit U n=1 Tax=Citrus sinensis TaxID=2711 RepID=A0ACB8P4U4_CITSI|nr:NAD(P)H-quinone oxidoreductase subunit U [Citrus sinensis]
MAAISSTTATVCISQKNFYTPSPKRNSLLSHSINSYFPTRPRKQLTVRNTGDVSAETGSTEIEPEARSDPSSLISALNVERALRGIAITDADHYGRLGLRRGCSFDEESYSILSSEEERRLYDWSLARTENPDRYLWPFEVDVTQTPKGTPPPQEPEDVGPTRLVGYFMLGWLILSFVLSIALNR